VTTRGAWKKERAGLAKVSLHNAPMESFWGVLKNEQIHHCLYATRQEAIQDITGYIEIFYNRQRKQARLRFLSPATYERWFYEKRLAA
jgi:transposase InsO family protein